MGEGSNTFNSAFGWQIDLPPDTRVCAKTPARGAEILYGDGKFVRFAFTDTPLSFTWDVAPGPGLEEEAVCRFLYLLEKGNPVDLEVLIRILAPIAPPLGSIFEANVVRMADDSAAIEIEESYQHDSIDVKSFCVLFEWPERRFWPSSEMMTLMQSYSDPYEKGIIFAYREEFAGLKNGRAQSITVGEPERLQRIMFVAPSEQYDQLINSVRASARSFQFKQKPNQLWQELDTAGPTARQALDLLKARRSGPGSGPAGLRRGGQPG